MASNITMDSIQPGFELVVHVDKAYDNILTVINEKDAMQGFLLPVTNKNNVIFHKLLSECKDLNKNYDNDGKDLSSFCVPDSTLSVPNDSICGNCILKFNKVPKVTVRSSLSKEVAKLTNHGFNEELLKKKNDKSRRGIRYLKMAKEKNIAPKDEIIIINPNFSRPANLDKLNFKSESLLVTRHTSDRLLKTRANEKIIDLCNKRKYIKIAEGSQVPQAKELLPDLCSKRKYIKMSKVAPVEPKEKDKVEFCCKQNFKLGEVAHVEKAEVKETPLVVKVIDDLKPKINTPRMSDVSVYDFIDEDCESEFKVDTKAKLFQGRKITKNNLLGNVPKKRLLKLCEHNRDDIKTKQRRKRDAKKNLNDSAMHTNRGVTFFDLCKIETKTKLLRQRRKKDQHNCTIESTNLGVSSVERDGILTKKTNTGQKGSVKNSQTSPDECVNLGIILPEEESLVLKKKFPPLKRSRPNRSIAKEDTNLISSTNEPEGIIAKPILFRQNKSIKKKSGLIVPTVLDSTVKTKQRRKYTRKRNAEIEKDENRGITFLEHGGTTFCINDVVWAKIPGYPFWPAHIQAFDKVALSKTRVKRCRVNWIGWNENSFLPLKSLLNFKEHFVTKYSSRLKSLKYKAAVELACQELGLNFDALTAKVATEAAKVATDRAKMATEASKKSVNLDEIFTGSSNAVSQVEVDQRTCSDDEDTDEEEKARSALVTVESLEANNKLSGLISGVD